MKSNKSDDYVGNYILYIIVALIIGFLVWASKSEAQEVKVLTVGEVTDLNGLFCDTDQLLKEVLNSDSSSIEDFKKKIKSMETVKRGFPCNADHFVVYVDEIISDFYFGDEKGVIVKVHVIGIVIQADDGEKMRRIPFKDQYIWTGLEIKGRETEYMTGSLQ